MIVPLDVELPEIPEAFSHLRELFFVMGQVTQTGMGIVRVTWEELEAFLRVNEVRLTPWERRILWKMSDAYCTEYSHATDPKRPAPYSTKKEADEEDAIAIGMGISAAMAAFRGKKVRK